jgi:HEAT repeat protein
LGQLKAVEAVEPLMETLSDADVSTRATSIGALAKIGDARAVPALIPLLGDAESVGLAKRTVSDFAADALDKLGQTEVALAFLQTLEGDKTAMETLKSTHRREVIQGLAKAAKSSRQPDEARINALRALGDLNAVEVLPELRLGLKLITLGGIMGRVSSARVREVCEQTISQLEAIKEATGTLPRPAESAAPDVKTLPRPAQTPEPDTETLPRPADHQRNVN